MDKKQVVGILNQFGKALEKRNVKAPQIILFGSHVNGTAHEDSDIDVVILSDSFEGKDYWERIDVLAEAIAELMQPIEAFALTQQEWDSGEHMVSYYARDGERISA